MGDSQSQEAASRHRAPQSPRVLAITRNLPPLVGGMERLVLHMIDALCTDYRVHALGPVGSSRHLPPEVSVSEVPAAPLWRFLLLASWRAVGAALKPPPRLVLAGSGLTAPFAWVAARIARAPCVVYLHGLDVETRHPLYRLLWRPFLRRCDRVLVNSRFTRDLAARIGIDAGRIEILPPGVELPDMAKAEEKRRAFRSKHGLDNVPLMLYVGRITARKGLAVFVQDILPAVFARQPRAKLVVVGAEPAQALKQSAGETRRVLDLLNVQGLSERVVFLGELEQDDPDLSAAYFAADALVFPVQSIPGDNEGFGMVAIEAAAHGLLTVAFSAGGVPDAVKDGVSGYLLDAGDNSGMAKRLTDLLSHTISPDGAASCLRFASEFSWPNFKNKLLTICQELAADPQGSRRRVS